MGKLREIKGYVQLTFDKLSSNKCNLIETYHKWHDWDFDAFTKEFELNRSQRSKTKSKNHHKERAASAY